MNDWGELISFVTAHACNWVGDPAEADGNKNGQSGWGIHLDDPPPYNRLLGPVFPRGDAAGVIRHKGRTLCQWGDTQRPDMTFSVTKTYLAMLAGIAVDQNLINNLDEPVSATLNRQNISQNSFADAHNKNISWLQLLQFTSEWRGECFGIPDQVDHFREVALQSKAESKTKPEKSAPTDKPAKGQPRELQTPGTYWEYNDVRINQFSLALMQLFGRPLPDLFDETIMQPLGINARASEPVGDEVAPANGQWQWFGYKNSWLTPDSGSPMQSVPGGGHWGGGMVICVDHQAAIAELLLNEGVTKKQPSTKLLPDEWVKRMRTPCAIAPFYGLFTWLNTNHCISESVPESCFFALGIGGQLIMHDPENDLLAVLRWIDSDYTADIIEMIYRIFRQ